MSEEEKHKLKMLKEQYPVQHFRDALSAVYFAAPAHRLPQERLERQ